MLKSSLVAAAAASATASFAQNSVSAAPLDPDRLKPIDSFIAGEMTRQGIPGLAVGIYSRGQILLAKQSSLDRIFTAYPLNDGKPNFAGYGFGWMMGKQNDRKRIEHGGAWEGFSCRISRYLDDSLTVMVFTNLDAEHSRTVQISRVIAGLVDPPLLPAKLVPIADTQAGTYCLIGEVAGSTGGWPVRCFTDLTYQS